MDPADKPRDVEAGDARPSLSKDFASFSTKLKLLNQNENFLYRSKSGFNEVVGGVDFLA